jgi:hypothetical protein
MPGIRHSPPRVDHFCSFFSKGAHGGDPAVFHAHVGDACRRATPVDHGRLAQQKVEHFGFAT